MDICETVYQKLQKLKHETTHTVLILYTFYTRLYTFSAHLKYVAKQKNEKRKNKRTRNSCKDLTDA